MPIPALIIDAELLPPPSCHRTLNGRLAPLKADAFKHRFGGCACALFVAKGSASGQVVDLVADLRRRAPLVPLAVLTDGDVLLKVNGRPTTAGRLFPDGTPGTRYDIVVQRRDELISVVLTIGPPRKDAPAPVTSSPVGTPEEWGCKPSSQG